MAMQVAVPVPLACGVTVEAAQATVPLGSFDVNFTVPAAVPGAIVPVIPGVIFAVKVTDWVATLMLLVDEEVTATVVPVWPIVWLSPEETVPMKLVSPV